MDTIIINAYIRVLASIYLEVFGDVVSSHGNAERRLKFHEGGTIALLVFSFEYVIQIESSDINIVTL